jgi:hypothetical protein
VLARIMLSRSTTLKRTSTDSEVEAAVIETLVSANKQLMACLISSTSEAGDAMYNAD